MVFPTPATDYLILLALWHRKKVVLTDVGGGGASLSTRIRKWLRFDLNRRAHGLALVSDYSARFFADWPQPKVVLWGGVRSNATPSWQPPQGFALFVGRLLPHKGVLPLIQALPPGVPLKIIGESYDPEYRRLLARAAEGRDVEFLGRVSDQALDDWYARASVVVQPSLPGPGADKSELLGLAAIEAMAHAKPVVVTSSGSLPDLVVPGVTGFVVPPGDPAALGEKIALLCRDPTLSIKMGRAAQRLARDRFTWEAAAERGLRLYRQVLAGSAMMAGKTT
jgi:glycosyltransferase involved in cell wall biosynthesis